MKLQIVERTGMVFEGEVSSVVVPTVTGEMGILPGHTPVLGVLEPGTVRYTTLAGETNSVHTGAGFVTLDEDEVMVVVDPHDAAGAAAKAPSDADLTLGDQVTGSDPEAQL